MNDQSDFVLFCLHNLLMKLFFHFNRTENDMLFYAAYIVFSQKTV